jgi:hypothetical protein
MTKRPRPIPFTPDHSDLARKFCMPGATDDDLARLLEAPRETNRRLARGGPRVRRRRSAGRDVADATVAPHGRTMGRK